MDQFLNRNPFTPPGSPILCGNGIADPYLRQDINGLATSRFSMGRFLSREIVHQGADIHFDGRTQIELFTYGVGESVLANTGFDDARNADASMTNCHQGGALVGRSQVLMTQGIAVQLGLPYVPEGMTQHYPSWLQRYEIRGALTEHLSMEMRHGGTGLLYRLGSLLSYGTSFGPMTGDPLPKPKVACGHVCGAQLKHQGMTFATCALEVDHEEVHRDGTIIWTNDGAKELANRKAGPNEPRCFSPFQMATALGTEEHYKPTVNLVLGNAGVSFENTPACPTSVCDSSGVARRTRVAVPVRVWLFGYPAIVPDPVMCGIPSVIEDKVMNEFLRNRPGYR